MDKLREDQDNKTETKGAANLDTRSTEKASAVLQPPPLSLAVDQKTEKGISPEVPEIQNGQLTTGANDDNSKTVQTKKAIEPSIDNPFQLSSDNTSSTLPEPLKKGTEKISGFSMDDVQVHYNSNKPAQLNAAAYAQGSDIHLAKGEEKHLPHEAWHVVQQKQGRVNPTIQKKNKVAINDDEALEKEADIYGAKAANAGSDETPNNSSASDPSILQTKPAEQTNAGPVQLRKEIKNPTAALTALRALTVKQFKEKLATDPDWSNGLAKKEKSEIDRINALIGKDEIAACENMRIILFSTVVNGTAEKRRNFRTYVKSVNNKWVKESGEVIKTPGLAEALLRGAAMWKLIAAFPDYILRNALTGNIFLSLYTGNLIEDLARYYVTARPIFQSKKDFSAYYDFRTVDNGNPIDFHAGALKDQIRSYHKFHKTTLERAQLNYGDTSKSKPLTLYIHAGIDWNGAFVRDPANDAMVKNSHTLVLLMEGLSSIKAAKSKIKPIATKYGQNKKIAQVMLAGHGDAQSMELTGEIKEGKDGSIEQTNESNWGGKRQDLNINNKKGKAFIDELIKHMESPEGNAADNGPHARIMFNACLTNSHDAAEAVRNGDIANTKEAIDKYIKEHPNLVEYTKKRAKELGNDKMETLGANASTYKGLGFMDPATGKLNYDTTNYTSDAASSVQGNKLDYIQSGREWTGLTRALIEELAKDKDAAIGAINTRLANAPANDKERFQQIGLKVVKAHFATKYQQASYLMEDVEKISTGKHNLTTSAIISWLDGDNFRAYYGDSATTKMYNGFKNTQKLKWLKPLIVFHQAWSAYAAKSTETVNYIGQQPCSYSSKAVDIAFLEGKGLLNSMLDGGGSQNGKIVLAVLALKSIPGHAKATAYLKGLLGADKKFPGGLDMATKVAGIDTVANLEALVAGP